MRPLIRLVSNVIYLDDHTSKHQSCRTHQVQEISPRRTSASLGTITVEHSAVYPLQNGTRT